MSLIEQGIRQCRGNRKFDRFVVCVAHDAKIVIHDRRGARVAIGDAPSVEKDAERL
jgi:hypothetical protein